MKFWDSSALIPLIVPEPETRPLGALLRTDPAMAAWWGSRLECAAALARLEREAESHRSAHGTGSVAARPPRGSVDRDLSLVPGP